VYEQLNLSERIYIQSQLELGFKAAAIAVALKRGPSTISRELRRNGRIAGRYSKCDQRNSQAKRECCGKDSLETRHHGLYVAV
jgi:IS30 family transposase